MTEKDENRVHHILDCCDVNGHLDIKADDMALILKYQRELGKEDVLAHLAEHDKEVRNKTIEEIIDSVDKMNNSGSHCVEDYCEDADSCTDCIAKAILRMLEQMKKVERMDKRLKYNLGANDLQEADEWLKKCFSCKHQYCIKDNPDEIRCNVKKCKYEKEHKNAE